MQVFTQTVLPDCKYLSKISLFIFFPPIQKRLESRMTDKIYMQKIRKAEVCSRNGLVASLA